MSIRIHHLNCGTMCPLCERLINTRAGSVMTPGKFVCHCLLIETPEGLVLVDTGLGSLDISQSRRRLGAVYPTLFKPSLLMEETAIQQVLKLGFKAEDVRHIIITHVDLDHAGGLSDFPHAKVHIFKPELEQLHKPSLSDRIRFRQVQFEHNPDWVVHEEQGEAWFGFNCIRAIDGLSTDVLLIPLVGHTRGHTGVAVKLGERWILHCGDAYYHHSQITQNPQVPAASMMFQRAMASIPSARVENLERLRRLALHHRDQVELFSAHDPVELARYATHSPFNN